MSLIDNKINNPINVISQLQPKPTPGYMTGEQFRKKFDEAPELLRLKFNELIDSVFAEFQRVDNEKATKTDLQNTTLGLITDGTITENKVANNAISLQKLASDLQDKINNSGGLTDVYYDSTSSDVDTGIKATIDQFNYIPIMTAANSGGFQATGTPFETSYDGWKAFDGSEAAASAYSSGTTSGTLQIKLDAAKVVTWYTFYASTVGNAPKDFTLQGSNDGSSWTTVHTVTGNSQQRFVGVPTSKTTPYLYYRLVATTNNGGYSIQILSMQIAVKKDIPVYKTKYVVTTPRFSYIDNNRILFKANSTQYIGDNIATSGTNPTANINNLGEKDIIGAKIITGQCYELRYIGTLDKFIASEMEDLPDVTMNINALTSSINITNLDLARDNGIYDIYIDDISFDVADILSMYVNNDTNNANYLSFNNNTAQGAFPYISTMSTTSGSIHIRLCIAGGQVLAYSHAILPTGSLATYSWICKSQSNVTSLMFKCANNNNIKNAKIRVYQR